MRKKNCPHCLHKNCKKTPGEQIVRVWEWDVTENNKHWRAIQYVLNIVSSNNFYVTFHANHDDVIKWKYFPRYWPFVRGIHRSPVNSPHKGQSVSSISAWINEWVNNREAGDLRGRRAHYDVIVMIGNFCNWAINVIKRTCWRDISMKLNCWQWPNISASWRPLHILGLPM